ncbi:MAG: tetratricopeptide repeat protein [Gammaproteobacteria bacterium]|nr:tetratricopeptide repeat protein [Gammaproteobacteria bacterium]
MLYRVIILTTLAFLGACAATPGTTTDASVAAASEEKPTTAAPVSEVRVVPERPFPDDSLYPLLVAEFALRRNNYKLALENYREQAMQLRDPGVSAHTTRLAQFMHEDDIAIETSQLWVELEPEQLEARLTLANLLARKGRSPEALPHMVALQRAGGTANFSALAHGFDKLSAAQQQALMQAIRDLRTEFPDSTQVMICQALLLEETDEIQLALKQLQAVFDVDPEQLQAIVLEVKLRQDIDQQDGLYDRIIAHLEDQPGNNRLRMQYARLLTRTDLAEARRQFQILLDQSPRDPDLLFSMALIQREMDDLEAANDKLEKLVSLGERTSEAHYYLGKIAEQQRRFRDAVMHYMLVAPGRDFVTATRRIASLLLSAGRLDEMSQYFIRLRGQYPQAQAQLYAIEATSLIDAEFDDASLKILNQALAEIPEDTSLQYMRSMVWEKQNDLALMEADLRAILEREPDNSTVLNALGYTLANRTSRYAEAEQLIARALELQPNEPAILDSMGWVKFHLGEHEEALKYLRQAYDAFPDPEVAAHLGEVLWVSGDSSGALAIWNSALSNNPDHELVVEAMERLGARLASD